MKLQLLENYKAYLLYENNERVSCLVGYCKAVVMQTKSFKTLDEFVTVKMD
jgi:hypothetical protein